MGAVPSARPKAPRGHGPDVPGSGPHRHVTVSTLQRPARHNNSIKVRRTQSMFKKERGAGGVGLVLSAVGARTHCGGVRRGRLSPPGLALGPAGLRARAGPRALRGVQGRARCLSSPPAGSPLHSLARGRVFPLKNLQLQAESASRIPLSGPPRFCRPLLGVPLTTRGHAGTQNELPVSGQLTSKLNATCDRHSVPCQVTCPQGPGITA